MNNYLVFYDELKLDLLFFIDKRSKYINTKNERAGKPLSTQGVYEKGPNLNKNGRRNLPPKRHPREYTKGHSSSSIQPAQETSILTKEDFKPRIGERNVVKDYVVPLLLYYPKQTKGRRHPHLSCSFHMGKRLHPTIKSLAKRGHTQSMPGIEIRPSHNPLTEGQWTRR